MIKYKTAHRFDPSITPVEIERETDVSVWINGRRSAKRSDWDNYFDSFDEAKRFLTLRAEIKLESARLALNNAQGYMGNVKGLKE